MIKKGYWLLGIISLTSMIVHGQAEANFWPIGYGAGIEFSSGAAEPLQPTGSTLEASASASDAEGNLLFYLTGDPDNGISPSCFNVNQEVMPNGGDLLLGASCTHGGLTIPIPNDPNRHYLFTIGPLQEITNLNYSIIDMSLDGGLGDITEIKNELLLELSTEKIAAVAHGNCTDFWLLGHQAGNADFYAWQITEDGILPPVISAVGSELGATTTFVVAGDTIQYTTSDAETGGQMKISPDGTKLAHAIPGLQVVELFDFDNLTGVVSNPNQSSPSGPSGLFEINDDTFFDNPSLSVYGLEWSPNSRFLYVSEYINNRVRQFDTNSPDLWDNAQDIHGTLQGGEFGLFSNVGQPAGLQLGPDGKIYIARLYSQFLSLIESPNLPGEACNFTDTAITWFDLEDENVICDFGLPPFTASYFNQIADFTLAGNEQFGCFGDSLQFAYNGVSDPDSILWNFGDPLSGIENSSSQFDVSHLFSGPGEYNVTLQVWKNCTTDSVEYTITVDTTLALDLGENLTACETDTLTLDGFTEGAFSYQWSTGQSTSAIDVNTGGWYALEVSTAAGCASIDSVLVEYEPIPDSSILPAQTEFCINDDAYQFNGAAPGGIWSGSGIDDNGLFNPAIGEGIYQVNYSFPEGNCPVNESLMLTVWPLPEISFQADVQDGCVPLEVNFLTNTSADVSQWSWDFGDGTDLQSGEQDASHLYSSPGTFDVNVEVTSIEGCTATAGSSDLIDVYPNPTADFSILIPDPDSEEFTIDLIDQSTLADSWEWTFGDGSASSSQNPEHTFIAGGSYNIELTVNSENGCTSSIIKTISFDTTPVVYVPNAFTPNGDGFNDVFKAYGDGIEDYELQIYNRWGELIFVSNDINTPWNGDVKGGSYYAQDGIYPWKIRCKINYVWEALTGHVTLLR